MNLHGFQNEADSASPRLEVDDVELMEITTPLIFALTSDYCLELKKKAANFPFVRMFKNIDEVTQKTLKEICTLKRNKLSSSNE